MEVYMAVLIGVPGVLALILTLVCFLLLTGCKEAAEDIRQQGQSEAVTTSTIKKLSRVDIQKKLQKLGDAPVPKDLKAGATCYKPAAPPQHAQYICPTCGEKTLYTNALARTVEWDIGDARRHLTRLQGLAASSISLDESPFCKHCSPDVTDPKLMLRIVYDTGQPHTAVGVTPADLQLLEEFLSNKIIHDSGQLGETPLRDRIPRIQELLGVRSR
jgi:predicted RNA-binding Zn-ribbon protein involved in translation (DUF1610 family)